MLYKEYIKIYLRNFRSLNNKYRAESNKQEKLNTQLRRFVGFCSKRRDSNSRLQPWQGLV